MKRIHDIDLGHSRHYSGVGLMGIRSPGGTEYLSTHELSLRTDARTRIIEWSITNDDGLFTDDQEQEELQLVELRDEDNCWLVSDAVHIVANNMDTSPVRRFYVDRHSKDPGEEAAAWWRILARKLRRGRSRPHNSDRKGRVVVTGSGEDSERRNRDAASVLERLLAAGADPNVACDRTGGTALHFTAYSGNVGGMKALLSRGAKWDRTDCQGCTPFHVAARSGGVDCVELLASAGCPVNTLGPYGTTALHWAATAGHGAVADALVALGADVNARTVDGDDAAMMADTGGNSELGARLRSLMK